MKIICASFQCESNSLAKSHPQKYDFEYFKGEDIFKKVAVKDIFTDAGYEVVPAISSVALPAGTVEKDIYFYYADQILQTVRENADACGVYIFSSTGVWKWMKSAAVSFIFLKKSEKLFLKSAGLL